MTKAVLALCLAAAALSGCADLSGRSALYDQREEKLSNVMGDTAATILSVSPQA